MRLAILAAILLAGCTLHYASQYQDDASSESTLLTISTEAAAK